MSVKKNQVIKLQNSYYYDDDNEDDDDDDDVEKCIKKNKTKRKIIFKS